MKSGYQLLNEYHVHDARSLTELLGSQRVDVTITSPPYWDVKDYGSPRQVGFRQSYINFLDDLVRVFDAVWEHTTPAGSLWIILDSVKKNGRVHLLPFDLLSRISNKPQRAWHLQDVLIWQKPHTLPWSHSGKLQGHFEYILCLSKSSQLKLNLDAIRTTAGLANWWVKYPERYHPLGKSLGNVWEFGIPTQGTWGNGHFKHDCPMPIEMAQRIILLTTDRAAQVVFDPFAGTGPVLVAAHSLGRQWIGTDVSARYREMFYKRLAHETPKATAGDAADTSESLTTANLRLRQLKYAVQIYKRVAPSQRLTTSDVPLILVFAGNVRKTPTPFWVDGSKIRIVVENGFTTRQTARIEAAVAAVCQNPPLTKYQLGVDVQIVTRRQLGSVAEAFGGKKLFRYSQGHFWRPMPADVKGLIRNRDLRLPDIISDLYVSERPAY